MKKYFELGVRLLALYSLLMLHKEIVPSIYYYFTDMIEAGRFYFNFIFANYIILFIVGIIVLIKPQLISNRLKYENIDSAISRELDKNYLLRVGILLVGLYYIGTSISNIVYFVVNVLILKLGDVDKYYGNSITSVIVIILSLLLMYKSKPISNFLLKDNKQ